MNITAIRYATDFLASWLPYRFAQVTLPGLAVAVAYRGKTIFSHSYGLPSTPLFGIASQSKMFTATAIMQLYEQQKLSLDTPIIAYVPWLAEHPQPSARTVTCRQLLSHSAGLSREIPAADFWTFKHAFPTRQELQNALLATPLASEPNTQLKYSNAGYGLLGLVIEAVSGQTYGDYITGHITRPLKLRTTFSDYHDGLAPRVAMGYGMPLDGTRPAFTQRQATNALAAVAGGISTPQDMCRFAAALCPGSGLLLQDTSKKEMQRTQWVQTDGYDTGLAFGLGLEITSMGNRQIIGHSGHIAGHLTATFFDPQDRLIVSVMATSKDAPSMEIVSGIYGVLDFFAEHASRRTPATRAKMNIRLLCEIASMEIVATHDSIVALDPDGWEPFAFQEELEMIDNTTLRVVTPGSIFNQHELVRYAFDGTSLKTVTYAGSTLVPEQLYRAHLSAH